jgi:DNA-binding NarL/FixJ family response regulator
LSDPFDDRLIPNSGQWWARREGRLDRRRPGIPKSVDVGDLRVHEACWLGQCATKGCDVRPVVVAGELMMQTNLVEARPMESVAPAGVVLILCRLLLISQAVGAALRGRGLDAEAAAWAVGVHRATEELGESDVVLLFDDLDDRDSVLAMQGLITHSSAQFLVLTHRPEGAAWGAMLAAGAAAVMPTESSLAEVDAALAVVREGGSPISEVKRSRLMREWFRWLAEDDALRVRLANLSPREREILVLLSKGSRVGDIVSDLGVAETTVRSHIRSIRRKLEVGSQLAAVAVVHRLGDRVLGTIEGPRPTLPGPRHPEL